MKKILAVTLLALLTLSFTACSQTENSISEPSVTELSEFSEETEESSIQSEKISEISSKKDEVSSVIETSKEVSEISEISQTPEISEEQSSQNSQADSENTGYTKQLVEKVVDVEKLGEKTKSTVTDVLESDEVYMNVTGKIALFGGITSNFDAEIAKSDDGIMEKFTFGDRSIKIIQNSDGTYTVDDETKTATRTGGAYEPDDSRKISDTNENYTSNSVANQIISYVSSSFGLDSLKYEKSGSEEYQNKTYSFDEYSSDGYTIKVYFDGNSPEYIVSTDKDNKTSVIEIHSLTSSADSEIFKIPENYKIVSE